MNGQLPDGSQTTTPAIDAITLLNFWHSNVVGNLLRAGASRHVANPNDYFMDRFGSTGNRQPLLLADRAMNQVKGRVFGEDIDPQSSVVFQQNLANGLLTGTGEEAFLEPIRQVRHAQLEVLVVGKLTNETPYWRCLMTRARQKDCWV